MSRLPSNRPPRTRKSPPCDAPLPPTSPAAGRWHLQVFLLGCFFGFFFVLIKGESANFPGVVVRREMSFEIWGWGGFDVYPRFFNVLPKGISQQERASQWGLGCGISGFALLLLLCLEMKRELWGGKRENWVLEVQTALNNQHPASQSQTCWSHVGSWWFGDVFLEAAQLCPCSLRVVPT